MLKIEARRVPAIAFGDTDNLQVGDVVLAIGNPSASARPVTSGIVSALGRNQLGINTLRELHPDRRGHQPRQLRRRADRRQRQPVGINTAIYSRSGGSLGIGFAIPVDTARQVMEGLVRDGQRHARLDRRRAARPHAEIAETLPPAGAPGRADHRRAAERPGQPRAACARATW